jgi:hypothetical protein
LHLQGPSAAGDAAAPSAACETAVSLSLPRQVPPKQSNAPRKRKESAARMRDEDDDFVFVPSKPSASFLATTVVRKIK